MFKTSSLVVMHLFSSTNAQVLREPAIPDSDQAEWTSEMSDKVQIISNDKAGMTTKFYVEKVTDPANPDTTAYNLHIINGIEKVNYKEFVEGQGFRVNLKMNYAPEEDEEFAFTDEHSFDKDFSPPEDTSILTEVPADEVSMYCLNDSNWSPDFGDGYLGESPSESTTDCNRRSVGTEIDDMETYFPDGTTTWSGGFSRRFDTGDYEKELGYQGDIVLEYGTWVFIEIGYTLPVDGIKCQMDCLEEQRTRDSICLAMDPATECGEKPDASLRMLVAKSLLLATAMIMANA